ncbi:hypothetical protein [Nostoc sp.]|uniref:hypothetical protein n=1 Tax=Nostoc sp. TaxID=1180 RepID=UPI002FF9464A
MPKQTRNGEVDSLSEIVKSVQVQKLTMTISTELEQCLLRAAPMRYSEIPFNYKIGWNDFLTVLLMKLPRLEQSFLMQR